MIYYSKLNNGFYDSDIHTVMPEDVIEIPVAYHQALIDGQATGQLISSNEEGYPILIDQPAISNDQLAVSIRAQRNALLKETDWVVLRAYEKDEIVPEAYADYRKALRDITLQSTFPASVEWPTEL